MDPMLRLFIVATVALLGLLCWLIWRDTRRPADKSCDHCFFPEYVGDKPVGQRCALCQHFDSLEDVKEIE